MFAEMFNQNYRVMKTTTELTTEIKELLRMNVSTADFQCLPGTFDKLPSGQYGYIIDWEKVSDRDINICLENMEIIKELTEARNSRDEILVGDYLEMPDGSVSRVTYCHDEGVQDGGGSGSFFLHKSGGSSYSGGLDGIKPLDKIQPTDRTQKALFWIFSKNWSGANRGFDFYIDVKVWKVESMLKTAYVKFADWKYNYHTSINGNLSDEEVKKYFVGKFFNLGSGENDDMQQCNDCAVYY